MHPLSAMKVLCCFPVEAKVSFFFRLAGGNRYVLCSFFILKVHEAPKTTSYKSKILSQI